MTGLALDYPWMTYMGELGANLRAARLATGLTQEDVAVRARISLFTYQKLEKGEFTIRDLKDQALAHFPSGHFFANAAWTVIAALAHNLLRQTQRLGLPTTTIRTARTIRRRLLTIPGRLVRSARRCRLRMPARWPWADEFLNALNSEREVPMAIDNELGMPLELGKLAPGDTTHADYWLGTSRQCE